MSVVEIAVFDSSAVLAVLLNEPGGSTAAAHLKGGLVSTVNLTETHAKLLLHGTPADVAWNSILGLQCDFCFFSDEQARVAAELIGATKRYGLSLGDRACLALAIERKATVYTADRAWKSLALGIDVEVIR